MAAVAAPVAIREAFEAFREAGARLQSAWPRGLDDSRGPEPTEWWTVCVVLPLKSLAAVREATLYFKVQNKLGLAQSLKRERAKHEKKKARKKARRACAKVGVEDAPAEQAPEAAYADDPLKEFKTLINRMAQAGLEYASFYSINKDEIYVKVRASESRLVTQAHLFGIQMPLDEARLSGHMRSGFCDGGADSKMAQTQHMHLAFDRSAALRPLYSRPADGPSCFNSMHRVKLVTDILQTARTAGGCDVPLQKRVAQGKISAYLVLHDAQERRKLYEAWMEYPFWYSPARMPFDAWRLYLGEAHALYMVFVGEAATQLLRLGVFGLGCEVVIDLSRQEGLGASLQSDTAGWVRGAFVVCLVVWGVNFSAGWRRVERRCALRWGTTGFKKVEPPRPRFKCALVTRKDGRQAEHFPPRIRRKRIIVGGLVTSFMITLVCLFIASYFYLEKRLGRAASLYNDAGIQIFTYVYRAVAIQLTEAENWRTESVFAKCLIKKLFIFNCINSYGSLLLNVIGVACDSNSCIVDIRYNLFSILISGVIVSNAVGLVSPMFETRYNARCRGADKKKMSAVEWQCVLVEFDETHDLIECYTGISTMYGFIALFGAAAPATALVAGIAHVALLRLEGHNYLSVHRRIEPRGVEDVGTFASIYAVLTLAGVATNWAIVIYRSEPFASETQLSKAAWYLGGLATLATLAAACHAVARRPDADVDLQLRRQEAVRAKLEELKGPEPAQLEQMPAQPEPAQLEQMPAQPELMPVPAADDEQILEQHEQMATLAADAEDDEPLHEPLSAQPEPLPTQPEQAADGDEAFQVLPPDMEIHDCDNTPYASSIHEALAAGGPRHTVIL
ncbi:calcium-activated chloride channel-domain-containing protein, partial [Pelagophyceae sp. CCMP2097]